LGGIAPPSTVHYYRQLTSRYRSRSPDGSYPTILIDSVDGQRFLQLVRGSDRQALVRYLQGEVAGLARAGADVALFASNTPHLVFDDVAAGAPIPLISIVEEAARSAETHGWRKLGLLGARIPIEGGFYEPVFARRGIAVVTPPGKDLCLKVLVSSAWTERLPTPIGLTQAKGMSRTRCDRCFR
jgi:aspartate racemase